MFSYNFFVSLNEHPFSATLSHFPSKPPIPLNWTLFHYNCQLISHNCPCYSQLPLFTYNCHCLPIIFLVSHSCLVFSNNCPYFPTISHFSQQLLLFFNNCSWFPAITLCFLTIAPVFPRLLLVYRKFGFLLFLTISPVF